MSTITTYSARGAYSKGVFVIFKEMVDDLVKNHELLWQLFLRDFKARYKQSLLGWLWVLLSPLISVATFYILNKSGVVRVGNIQSPYVLWGLIGITFWQVFSNGLGSVTGSITSAGSIIEKIRFPNEVLVVSSLALALPSFIIRMVMVVVLFFIYGTTPSWFFLIFPIFLLPLAFMTLGIGFLTSLFNVVIRDVANLVGSLMSLLLFLTPIMYALPKSGLLGKANTYNPLFFLVSVPRDLILYGSSKYTHQYFWYCVLSVAIFIIGWFIFHVSQTKLVERL